MIQSIHAIYEGGVFKPLDPVQVGEHEKVELTIRNSNINTCGTESEELECQRESLAKLRAAMDVLPSDAPLDGLGGADHDEILYGWKK